MKKKKERKKFNLRIHIHLSLVILSSHIDRHHQSYSKSYICIYIDQEIKENKPTDYVVECTRTKGFSFMLKQKKKSETTDIDDNNNNNNNKKKERNEIYMSE